MGSTLEPDSLREELMMSFCIKSATALYLIAFSMSASAEVIWRKVESSKLLVSEYEVDSKRPNIPEHSVYGFGWSKPIQGCDWKYYALGNDEASNILLVHLYLAAKEHKTFKVAIDNQKYINGMCTIVDISPRN